jgi:hypothetical protein
MGLEMLAERAADLESRLADPAAKIEAADLEGINRDFELQADGLRAFVAP